MTINLPFSRLGIVMGDPSEVALFATTRFLICDFVSACGT